MSVNTSNVVDFEFFEKPTKNPHVILASSALGMRQKRNIFVSEALRRLRNTSQKLGSDIQNKHLSEFMLKLKESGYDSKFRAEVVQSAKSAYSIQHENDRESNHCIEKDIKSLLTKNPKTKPKPTGGKIRGVKNTLLYFLSHPLLEVNLPSLSKLEKLSLTQILKPELKWLRAKELN